MSSDSPPPSDTSSSQPPPDPSASQPPPDPSSSQPPPDPSSSQPPPDSSSSPPPPDSSSSQPPPDSSSSPPPSDNNSSPPPPASTDSQPPPDATPPPNSDSTSPPAPSGGSPTPPPQSGSNNSNSPAPPTSSTQPPPSDSGGNKGNDNSGDNNEKSSPSNKEKGDSHVPSSRSGDGHSNGDTPKLSDKSGSSNENSIITGAAVGAGLLLLLVIVFLVSCSKRKKRRKHDHELKYYRDNSKMKNYYNNAPNWQHRPPNDLMMKMPPHGMSGEHGWGPPPPPPPMMSSSEMSSAGFSGQAMPPPHPAVAMGFNQSNFTYEDLAAATGGFARENLLGQGGFGYVHKGVLPNGKEIAVKSLKMNSGQGEREFQAEVDIISRVHHRHLVSLVGWCSTGAERLLVYEFVPNGTLEFHLHGAGRPTMDWPTRVKIALGAAKGFAYLHEDCHPRIIHRDIKAANILIDLNFDAKVADFGLAKLSNDNHTHVSTRIMGTFGYLAPEYASSGKLTEKSDVYSFGVMLLELITGRRPIDINSDDDSLVDWARPILTRVVEGGSYEELVDPRLGKNYDHQQMLQMVYCAGASIKHSARGRPRMSQIVRALEGDVSLEDLNAGSRGSMLSSNGSDYDLKRLGKGGVVSSQEFSSSDEGQTGEFRT